MKKKKFGKDFISIEIIGHQRFWFGIIAGLFSSIILSLIFNYTRESMRMFTSLNTDLLILTTEELKFYNFFFSSLSCVLGLSITIWLFLHNTSRKRKKDRIYKQLGQVNILLIFWTVLMMLTRFGTLLPLILFGTEGYDAHFNFYEDYLLLLILLPIVIFAQNWFIVRLIYKSTKWIIYSFFICFGLTIILANTTTINQEQHNNNYLNTFKDEFMFIEDESYKARTNYQIEFSNNTIETLKKWKTQSSLNQVIKVKNAFRSENKITLDTIILQKIIFHNFKIGGWYRFSRNSIDNWHYATPLEIYEQIKKFDRNSNETIELTQIIKEQIELINTQYKDGSNNQKLTRAEWRKQIFVRYNISTELIDQLKKVRVNLITNKYMDNLILPEIDYEEK